VYNADYIFPTTYTGFANNACPPGRAEPHPVHGRPSNGTAPPRRTAVDATCKMKLGTIDRLMAKANMMGGGMQGTPQIQPIMIDGEEHFVLCMSPWDEFNLRTNTSTGQWLDIQKAAAPHRRRLARSSRAAWGCTTTWCCTSTRA
jgi:hypothetical protein